VAAFYGADGHAEVRRSEHAFEVELRGLAWPSSRATTVEPSWRRISASSEMARGDALCAPALGQVSRNRRDKIAVWLAAPRW